MIYINFVDLRSLMLHTKFQNHRPSGSEEDYGHIHVYSPGAGADNPLGPKYFLKHKSSVHLLISSKFSAI